MENIEKNAGKAKLKMGYNDGKEIFQKMGDDTNKDTCEMGV